MKTSVQILIAMIFVGVLISGCGPSRMETINGLSLLDITKEKGVHRYPDWSPDGENIVYQFFDSEEIWSISKDGNIRKKLIDDRIFSKLSYRKHFRYQKDKLIYVAGDPFKDFGENTEVHIKKRTEFMFCLFRSRKKLNKS